MINANEHLTQPVLIVVATGEPVKIGDSVISFRGESATVVAWEVPRHVGSTGRVTVKENGYESSYFPTVFGLAFTTGSYHA